MQQPIVGNHLDEQQHWVAELACGHNPHVRHNPPWVERPWVTTAAGRESMLGYRSGCRKCDRGEPLDNQLGARVARNGRILWRGARPDRHGC